jgi:hypothetical protein
MSRQDTLSAWIDRTGVRETPVEAVAHLGPRGSAVDPSRHRHLPVGDSGGTAPRRRKGAEGHPERPVRRRRARRHGGIDLELGIPDQQESVDQLLRAVHGRDGLHDPGHLCLADRCQRPDPVGGALRDLRQEPAGGLHRVGGDGAPARHGAHDSGGGRACRCSRRSTEAPSPPGWRPGTPRLLYAVGFVALWYGLLKLLERRALVLRV